MAKIDPTKMKDWEVAEAAEENMKSFAQLGEELGLEKDDLIPMGKRVGKVDFLQVMSRVQDRPQARYIDVTAISKARAGSEKSERNARLAEKLRENLKRRKALRRPREDAEAGKEDGGCTGRPVHERAEED